MTGAFGRLGLGLLRQLLSEGDEIVAFDVDSKAQRRAATKLLASLQTDERSLIHPSWGDIRNAKNVRDAIEGCDAVIHNAGILAPASESNPELSYAVNVDGTKNVIAACKGSQKQPVLLFASSISVCGRQGPDGPIATSDTPAIASDHYTAQKKECEELIRASGTQWILFRIGASAEPSLTDTDMDTMRMMFEVHPKCRIEYVHPLDVAIAQSNGVRTPAAVGKVLMIGGGETCRTTYDAFFNMVFSAAGIPALPREAFGDAPFYSSWMNTSESQALLQFQTRTLDDVAAQAERDFRWVRFFVKPIGPLARRGLLRYSGPWQRRKQG
ncbi:MAG: NAD(P)-dependent oxidoreductase [Polyangiales bacterium]